MHLLADNPNNRMSRRRGLALAMAVLLVFGLYAVRLFQIQIVEGEEYAELASQSYEVNISISASRGEILDRYLRPIAVNQTSYTVLFDYNYFPRLGSEETRGEANRIILDLAALLSEAGEAWDDTLPITKEEPYAFEEGRESSIASLKEQIGMADYATAENCMDELVRRYGLEGYTAEEQRIIAGVRYEMTLQGFGERTPFSFASGVSRETMYKITENNDKYPGVDVRAMPVREYVQGDVGSHLIGTVGKISAEEYPELKEKGYALNDVVGKSGIEAAMEDSLRGTTGTRTLVKDSSGNILEEIETQASVPGKSVVLTLDTELQAVAQQALDDKIKELRARPATSGGSFANNGHDVQSGSVVLLDVNTGGVLVCASWPSYDLSTYTQNYNELANDPDKPLFNRALYGAYMFGSTAKPMVAVAAMMTGAITPSTSIYCTGKYTLYEDYQPRCLGTHRATDVSKALTVSCNYFFYETGYRTGIDAINEYAALFGLGQATGIEIGESTGFIDSPEYRQSIGQTWSGGDTLRAAIGQTSNVTPIQLAAYAMTLANDGVRYKTHLVHSVRSYDGTTESVVEPEVAARIDLSQETIDAVRQGMIGVIENASGTGHAVFGNAPYTLAGKTGTAQISTTKSDNGVFIGYAPVENPEVAIAVLMEQGTSRPASQVARTVLDAYFSSKSEGLSPTPPNELLP